MTDSEWAGVCTLCGQLLNDREYCATKDRPFCPTCWMIDFYGFPEDRLRKVEAELAGYRQMGVDEQTLKRLLWSALRAHANKLFREQPVDMALVIDRMLAVRD
jgi:hypothetical protein